MTPVPPPPAGSLPQVGERWFIKFPTDFALKRLVVYSLTATIVGLEENKFSDIQYYRLKDVEFVEKCK